MPSPSHQDVLSPDVTESQEDTILTAMATTVTTGDIDLDIPKTETPTMVPPLIYSKVIGS